MREEDKLILKKISLERFKEYNMYNQNLYAITLFPYSNLHTKTKCISLILNFSFLDINFNKKKVLPFFLAMELITNKKCIATLSSKNILACKLRKGMLVGCKITLRKKNLEDFIDTLILTLPRMDKFVEVRMKKKRKNITNFFSFSLTELFLFHTVEMGLGINTEVRELDLNFILNSI